MKRTKGNQNLSVTWTWTSHCRKYVEITNLLKGCQYPYFHKKIYTAMSGYKGVVSKNWAFVLQVLYVQIQIQSLSVNLMVMTKMQELLCSTDYLDQTVAFPLHFSSKSGSLITNRPMKTITYNWKTKQNTCSYSHLK